MQTIYCIPGLGADEGVFQYLNLSFVKPVFLKWIEPLKNESLHHYAMRFKEKYIHDEKPLIFGLSLGGMIAVEIANAIPSSTTIIISSVKTKNEIPFHWKIFRYFPVYKILPEWPVKNQNITRNFFLGAKKNFTKKYVKRVAKHADVHFYRWATGAIVNWQNEIVPSNVIHLHGTNDKLLPYKFVQADITINNGGHLMIMENAQEISQILRNIICG
ncbi:MAG: alpha/beta hydrolase [Parafilimonas sp.]